MIPMQKETKIALRLMGAMALLNIVVALMVFGLWSLFSAAAAIFIVGLMINLWKMDQKHRKLMAEYKQLF